MIWYVNFVHYIFVFGYDILNVTYIISIGCAIITSIYAPNTVKSLLILANTVYLCYRYINCDRSSEIMRYIAMLYLN